MDGLVFLIVLVFAGIAIIGLLGLVWMLGDPKKHSTSPTIQQRQRNDVNGNNEIEGNNNDEDGNNVRNRRRGRAGLARMRVNTNTNTDEPTNTQELQNAAINTDENEDNNNNEEGQGEEEEEEEFQKGSLYKGKKVGAKKAEKLKRKEERKKYNESEKTIREQNKKKHQEDLELLQEEEAQRKQQEKIKLAEILKAKQEREKQAQEELQKWKGFMEVQGEGSRETEEVAKKQRLKRFAPYIKQQKVVRLEDLAIEFEIKMNEVVEEITRLIKVGELDGVIDDRGKFIEITNQEWEELASFIKSKGRVSITEIASASNTLIQLRSNVTTTPVVTEEEEKDNNNI